MAFTAHGLQQHQAWTEGGHLNTVETTDLSSTNPGGETDMSVQIPLQRIDVPPGQQILLHEVS